MNKIKNEVCGIYCEQYALVSTISFQAQEHILTASLPPLIMTTLHDCFLYSLFQILCRMRRSISVS